MQIRFKNVTLKFDAVTLLIPLIAAALGEGQAVCLLMISLFAHESAHLAMARALGISVRTLRLTPFGGLAQLDNPYAIPALRLSAVAAAGPAANLTIVLIAAALCHWSLMLPAVAAQLVPLNVLLMLFNLFPALPLDGGRILYALLSMRLPRSQAVQIGIFLGRILAACLTALSLWGWIQQHTLNLSPLFAALFLLISASDERKALTDGRIQTFVDSLKPLKQPTPAALIAIDAQASPETALRSLRPGQVTLFALFQNGQFARLVDDRTMLSRLIDDPPKAPP